MRSFKINHDLTAMGQRTALWGGIVWVVYAWITVPNVDHSGWAHALLLMAALVLVPLALELVEPDVATVPAFLEKTARVAQFPAALLLAWSCSRPVGGWAAATAAPWVLVCAFTGARGLRRLSESGWRLPLDALCIDCALAFLGVGGAWVFADRAGFRPLGFSETIVTLTAVHFHFAGLLLPLIAGLTVRTFSFSRFTSQSAVGVVLGVPAVAIGITTTQLGWGPAFEAAAGCGLAVSGLSIAILQLQIATEPRRSPCARALFLIAGLSLFFGMLLAGIYASRAYVLPLPWLDVPWMRALHGTANAVGFGLCGVLAWRCSPRELDVTVAEQIDPC
jgi:hypothetical protein